MPLWILATFAGMKSCQTVNEKVVRKIMIVLLILSGVLLIVQNI